MFTSLPTYPKSTCIASPGGHDRVNDVVLPRFSLPCKEAFSPKRATRRMRLKTPKLTHFLATSSPWKNLLYQLLKVP